MKRAILDADEDRRRTILKNRMSARKSVERRNQLMTSLQEQNEALLAQNRSLKRRVEELERQLGHLSHSVSTSLA